MTPSQDRKPCIRQGVDLAAFDSFREYASANPEAVQFQFEAQGDYEGRAVHTRATTGPYTLGGQRIDRVARQYSHHLGAHQEVEAALGFVAPTDREEVIELALAALSGCINAVVSMSALARGIELQRLHTTVRIEWDPSVFLHLEDPERDGSPVDQFGDLQIELAIAGEHLSNDDIRYIEESVKRSAVFNLMTQAHRSTTTLHVQEAGARLTETAGASA